MKKLFAILLLTLIPAGLSAEPTAELTRYLEREIGSVEHALTDAENPGSPTEDEAWYFRAFMFRLRANAGVDIKGIGKFLIVPEVEMVWLRDIPDGWKTYKP